MQELNEEKKLAILYTNLKGRKKKIHDWIYIAEICKELKDDYGSIKKVSENSGVSYEEIRSILKLLELSKEVQQLIKEGKILQDAAQRITRIDGEKNQIKVANAIIGLNAHDQREIIQYAKRYPEASLEEYRKRLIDSKGELEKIHVMIIPLREETYYKLKKLSNDRKTSPEKLIIGMVNQQIKSQYGEDL